MHGSISHDREDEESMAAKVRWFRTLTHEERLNYLCEIATLALARNPHLADVRDDEYAGRSLQIVERP
jgi:hypothetical protein